MSGSNCVTAEAVARDGAVLKGASSPSPPTLAFSHHAHSIRPAKVNALRSTWEPLPAFVISKSPLTLFSPHHEGPLSMSQQIANKNTS